MSLIKKLTSAVLSVCIGTASFAAGLISPVDMNADSAYVYDNTISDNCKDPVTASDDPFNVFDIYNAYHNFAATTTTAPATTVKVTTTTTTAVPTTTTKKTTTTAKTTTVTTTKNYAVKRNGIDVSKWQTTITWPSVKNSGKGEFAIIKAGQGTGQIDPRFAENMKNAQAAGVDVGVYWYTTAMSVNEIRQEAYACLDAIKGYSFTYPVYLDFEHKPAIDGLDSVTLSLMIGEFCTILENNGYFVGVYASGYYLEKKLIHSTLSKYSIWVAEYNVPSVQWWTGAYDIWQYSSKGSVAGISTDVDLDICYRDLPAIIGVNPKGGRVPATSTTAATTKPVTTTTTTTTAAPNARGYIIEDTTTVYNWSGFDKQTHKFAMLVVQSWQDFDVVKQNIDAAHAAGISCGIMYLAEDANEVSVKNNAERLYNMLKNVKLEYPVYYWINKSDLSAYTIDTAQHSKNISAFNSYLEGKGYYVGIAAYDHVLANYIDSEPLRLYGVWLFNEKGTKIGYTGNCGMISEWNNEIGGFAHYAYKDFPGIMAYNGLNGYPKKQ